MTTEQTVDKIIDAHAECCRGEIDTRTLLSRIGDVVEEVQKEERAKAFAKGYEKGKSYRDAIEGSIPQSMIDQQVVLAESEAYKKGYIDGGIAEIKANATADITIAQEKVEQIRQQERDRIWHEHLGLGKDIREVLGNIQPK
jgi:hypothetical protein